MAVCNHNFCPQLSMCSQLLWRPLHIFTWWLFWGIQCWYLRSWYLCQSGAKRQSGKYLYYTRQSEYWVVRIIFTRDINSLAPRRYSNIFWICNFQILGSEWYTEQFLWNCPHLNAYQWASTDVNQYWCRQATSHYQNQICVTLWNH